MASDESKVFTSAHRQAAEYRNGSAFVGALCEAHTTRLYHRAYENQKAKFSGKAEDE
jgi:hypothetical protein